MAKSKFRLQFDVTEEALEVLDELKNSSGANTRAEVVRNALRLYSWFIEQRNLGNKIIVEEGKDREKVTPLFL